MPIPSVSDAKKFRYISDYPIDKIVVREQDSQVIPHASSASNVQIFTYPHGLSFRPLCHGIYSDDDFVTHYEAGNDPWFIFSGNPFPKYSMIVTSDTSDITVQIINYDSSKTLGWKVFGLAPSDAVSSTINVPNDGIGNFVFNSDYNYLKLFMDTTDTVSVASFGDETVTFTHNLGYRPQFLAWTDYDGDAYLSGTENSMGVSAVSSYSYATDTTIVCELLSNSLAAKDVTVHVKIYLDE